MRLSHFFKGIPKTVQRVLFLSRPARLGYELRSRIDSSLSRVLGKATAAPEASEPPD